MGFREASLEPRGTDEGGPTMDAAVSRWTRPRTLAKTNALTAKYEPKLLAVASGETFAQMKGLLWRRWRPPAKRVSGSTDPGFKSHILSHNRRLTCANISRSVLLSRSASCCPRPVFAAAVRSLGVHGGCKRPRQAGGPGGGPGVLGPCSSTIITLVERSRGLVPCMDSADRRSRLAPRDCRSGRATARGVRAVQMCYRQSRN
jgi:hypothetical protein